MSTAYLLAFGALPCSGTHLVLVPLCCVSLCYSQISLPLSSQWLRPTSKLIRYLFRAVLVWGRHKILGPDAGSQGQQNPCLVHRDIRTHVPAPDTKCLLFHLVDGGMSWLAIACRHLWRFPSWISFSLFHLCNLAPATSSPHLVMRGNAGSEQLLGKRLNWRLYESHQGSIANDSSRRTSC